MKLLLVFIAILIGCGCFGQKKDTIKSVWTTGTRLEQSSEKELCDAKERWSKLKRTNANDAKRGYGLIITPKKDSLLITKDNGLYIADSANGSTGGISTATLKWLYAEQVTMLYRFTITPKQDTVRVIMLVCDTSLLAINQTGRYYSFMIGAKLSVENREAFVYWQFGYEVYGYGKYLDQNKMPLPKSIVVWLTKEIKQ